MPWQNSVFALLIITSTGKSQGLFIYSGAPAAGNPPFMFGVAPGTTKDPFGNNLETNTNANAVFGAGTVGGGQLIVSKTGVLTFDNGVAVGALPQLLPDTAASLLLLGGQRTAGDQLTWFLDLAKGDSGQAVAQFLLARTGSRPVPATTALLEVQDPIAVSSAAAGGNVLQVTDTTAAPTSAILHLFAQAAADRALGIQVAADTVDRLSVDSNGRVGWGPGGATARDTFLSRLAANVLQLEANSGLAFAAGTTPAAQAGAPLLYASSLTPGRLREVAPSGFDLPLSTSSGDAGSLTVTQAAFTALTATYTPNANDGSVATGYRIRTRGTGTWGSTQQTLTLGVGVGGAGPFAQLAVPAAAFAISTAFQWEAEATVQVLTTGAGGTCTVTLRAILSAPVGPVDVVKVRHSTGVAFNTTLARALNIQAQWAATTGAPTITSNGSDFERTGV